MCTRKVGSRITCELQKTSYVCSVGKARYNRHTCVYKAGTLYYPLLCITLVIVWESLRSQLEKSTKNVINYVTFTSTCTCSCEQIQYASKKTSHERAVQRCDHSRLTSVLLQFNFRSTPVQHPCVHPRSHLSVHSSRFHSRSKVCCHSGRIVESCINYRGRQ